MLWFTSDNHFFHGNVIKYSNRPYESVQDMNDKMRAAWNRVVQPQDTVWMLGDVGFAKAQTQVGYLSTLNGSKHLCYGNHDKELRKAEAMLLEKRVFLSIQEYKELKHDGHLFVLAHYAHRTWNKAHHDSIHLFGHTHGELPPLGKSVDVGVDDKNITAEYRPVSVIEVLDFMKNRPSHTKHHDRQGE